MTKQLTNARDIQLKLEALYRDRERLGREFEAGQVSRASVQSVEEDITILEAQLRAKDARAHHHHFSESETPEHD